MINITTKNFDKLLNLLDQETQNVFVSLVKAHSSLAAEASKTLKQGLSQRAGRSKDDADYRTSPKGEMPYAHSMRLRNSIGFKVVLVGNNVWSEVGSGSMANTVEYAKFLENDGHGIRPFLWYVRGIYNEEELYKKFNQIHKSKLGKKNDWRNYLQHS